jgi:RP/EB family microtubule-associated protein
MRKVNWMAKSDHEFIPNYKVLQAGFDKNDIDKHIEVDRLIRGKYQDNLEFLQWMKCHWDREKSDNANCYDPVKARDSRPLPPWAHPAIGATGVVAEKENRRPPAITAGKSAERAKMGVAVATGASVGSRGNGVCVSTKLTPKSSVSPRCGTMQRSQSTKDASVNGLSTASDDSSHKNLELQKECNELRTKVDQQTEELSGLRDNLDVFEQERDYYFQKLREVEVLMETLKADPDLTAGKIIDDVQRVLYDSAEETMDGPSEREVPIESDTTC